MSKLNTTQIAALRNVVTLLLSLVNDEPAAPIEAPKAAKAKKAKAADVVAPQLEPVTVVSRPNGLLTAVSAKAIRAALAGTSMAGTNVNGNTSVATATTVLTTAGVPFTVVAAAVSAADAMVPVRAAKATAPKAETAPVTVKATPAQAKAVNKQLAALAREHGVTPTGSAWAELKNGERSWKKLRKLNAAEGIEAPKASTPKVAIVAEIGMTERAAKVQKLVDAGFTHEEALQFASA